MEDLTILGQEKISNKNKHYIISVRQKKSVCVMQALFCCKEKPPDIRVVVCYTCSCYKGSIFARKRGLFVKRAFNLIDAKELSVTHNNVVVVEGV